MKKYVLPVAFSLISVIAAAQDDESPAYKTGYSIGKVLGYVLIAGLVIWGIYRLVKKSK